ncbi:MAG: hypothetical protein HZA50_13610 [Planctomycetes bacterium]|nr:hypothetical protein [Planctomycetota bacterium]
MSHSIFVVKPNRGQDGCGTRGRDARTTNYPNPPRAAGPGSAKPDLPVWK